MELLNKEVMEIGKRGKGYNIESLSGEEIKAIRCAKKILIEKGDMKPFEKGDSNTWKQKGGFLLEHFHHLRTGDGKVHGLLKNGGRTYPPPKIHEGQQFTTCADCGGDVVLHADFKPGDIAPENGAYCIDCFTGHSERWINLVLVDLENRFKTVYKPNHGAYLMNWNVMRTYSGDAWLDYINKNSRVEFYNIIDDPSGLFNRNTIVVKIVDSTKVDIIDNTCQPIIISEEITPVINSCIENKKNMNKILKSIERRREHISSIQDKIGILNNELELEKVQLSEDERKIALYRQDEENNNCKLVGMIKKYIEEQAGIRRTE